MKAGGGCFLLFLVCLHPKYQIFMGRGDKRTKRGKISMGSFGKLRIARRTKKAANAKKNKEALAAQEAAKQA
jgi:30S ribosomal protein S31